MDASKEDTSFYQENKRFSSRSFTSREEFALEYRELYSCRTKAKGLYLQILSELERSISVCNVVGFKELCTLIIYISNVENQTVLKSFHDDTGNPIANTNLVILACKHNAVEILKYVFSSSEILNTLSVNVGEEAISLGDKDEACHSAFYYAMRSGSVELLDALIKQCPGNYFVHRSESLNDLLSRTYEELKLKNVPLTDEIQIFVERELINARFFSNNTSTQEQGFRCDPNNIRERIELILENINLLNSNTQGVDEKFIFAAKFVARNIYVLKRQMKSTYDRLPWEEIEFCLISFICCHTKQQEMNLFYRAALNKSNILKHLMNFAKKLEDEKDIINEANISRLALLPALRRQEAIAKIVSSHPQFEELYNDYQPIRDVRSLQKISDSIKLALSADPEEREGQLIITRVLQVIGEYFKNTLESPKLSNSISELFLLSLPKNTRKIITDLRNSLSHAYSLSKRREIEEKTDVSFFTSIQNDIKKIDIIISDIFYNNKIKAVKTLLTRIVTSDSLHEIREVVETFTNVELGKIISDNMKMMEHVKLEKLVKEFSDTITDQTNYEKGQFAAINNIINSADTQSNNMKTDYVIGFSLLKAFSCDFRNIKINHSYISQMKCRIGSTLKNMNPNIEARSLKEIAQLLMEITRTVRSRLQDDSLDKVIRLTYEVFYIVEFKTGDLKWIEKLRKKLKEKDSFTVAHKQRKSFNVTGTNKQLSLKLSELESILSSNSLRNQLSENLSFYKSDKEFQAAVEMLVLDIMTILGSSKHHLENNLLFLDDNTPLLIGKCLRNYLAHDNELLDILTSDPSIAVILNAKKLIEENIMTNQRKIGKLVSDDPSKLREKYVQDLVTVTNQERMFAAVEEGNLEILKDCLRKGSDINARSMNLWSTLHYAAKGASLQVVKYVLDQNVNASAKDIDGQSPLHVAAAQGRKSIVEFLVRNSGLYIDDVDNTGKTPLHNAARDGHKDTVEVLLEYKASTTKQDVISLSPLFYAIMNNHIDVVDILLQKDVSDHESAGGFTPLHSAVENGYLELVNLLLENKASVNAGNDRNWTPLHAAAYNGHLDIAKVLILNGADVNAAVINGCTSLYYAVEIGHEKLAIILLKHGASVNAAVKMTNTTPLHYAASAGHVGIVNTLLGNKANAGATTVDGMTPLHLAAQSGHLEIAATLLKHGVDIHPKSKNNSTPLHLAAKHGHRNVAELLIKNRANINAKDNNNLTPLHLAAVEGRADVTALLIENKVEVDARDRMGGTPLQAAALKGRMDIVDLLIRSNADVNISNSEGLNSVHAAALSGREDVIVFLIENKAKVNSTADNGSTPLHAAVVGNHKEAVNILLKNKARVDARGLAGGTPLYIAVEAGFREIVEILIANGANVNKKVNSITPLLYAVRYNRKEIVEVLVENGASVNAEDGKPLSLAVYIGYREIVDILLKNRACVNMKYVENVTVLHMAATRDDKRIVNALLAKGADVNAVNIHNETPLYVAAQKGHEEVVEVLLLNGADINAMNIHGPPLHSAAATGHSNIIELLLNNGANINMKDKLNRTSVELAASYGHLQVVRTLLQHKEVDVNAKGNGDWTLLHIAAQGGHLEVIRYLVGKGANIHDKNHSGSKAIHVAAREGYRNVVEFFVMKGLSTNEFGHNNQTLLHYCAIADQLEVAEYLIKQGADVNSKDLCGITPIHIAAVRGCKNVIEILLKNGAIYNIVDILNRTPLDITNNKAIINLLVSTEKLFEAVKRHRSTEVAKHIKEGAFVNAKNLNNVTPLHYAAWKGYIEVVDVLLRNQSNLNAVGNKGFTPLHYAAKFSNLKVIIALLSNGAIYNAVSDSGKTPLDFAVDKNIINLLKLVGESFKNITNNNARVVSDLNNMTDIHAAKAVLCARNRKNRTLVVAAVRSNFSKIEELKQVLQGDVSVKINLASTFLCQGNHRMALTIYESVFEKRKEIFGSDNPGTLDIQTCVAQVLYAQGAYQDALNTYENIYQKQKEVLGLDHKDTLSTRNSIAFFLYTQGKNEEALNIYREIYRKQKEILGRNHTDTLDTNFHMALVLDRLGKYEEALNINRTVFEKRKAMSGPNDPATFRAQNNIALVLANQGKFEEALRIYEEVLEKKKAILGDNLVIR